MPITFPSDTSDIIDEIRDAIGQDVDFIVLASSVICNVCGGINPMTGKSVDPLCPTCSGEGYLYYYNTETVNAHVTWGSVNDLDWRTGGKVFVGDCRVQIKKTDANESIVENTEYVVVDNVQMAIDKVIYRGKPEPNRILVDLIERDKDNA